MRFFYHYQTLPLKFYKKNNTGDLMNRISEDVSKSKDVLRSCFDVWNERYYFDVNGYSFYVLY